MNYWHMQLHPDNRNEVNRDEVLKIIKEKNIIGLGKEWENDRGQPNKFSNEMKIGDLVLVRSEGPLALVQVTGDCQENEDVNIWFELSRKIRVISLEGNKFKNQFKNKFKSSWNEALYLPTTIELANNSRFINYWYNTLKKKKEMQNVKNILFYKKQIILQGPPGTGKTRMAKMLAHELTKSEVKLSPFEYVEWYIKNFKVSKISKDRNLNQYHLLKEFSETFPVEKLSKITLEDYCLGKGSTTSFCYWIEIGLKELGRFSPGQGGTTVYGVYYSKDEQAYKSTLNSPKELIIEIQIALSELIREQDYAKARNDLKFRFSYILKILNSYFPEKYFPIVSHEHLKAIANIFGIEIRGLDDVQVNKKINDIFLKLKQKYSSAISSLDLMGHLYHKFKIKKGEFNDVEIEVVEELGETKLIQFHPAYSYEDFVRGIVVETNQQSQVEYKVVNKILAEFAQNALENPNTNYVLIIDEINRANLPSVLGELIYALEYRYDEEKKNAKEASVESIYALKQKENEVEGDNTLLLPSNLYIIGTMNTADRSVGHIDYAIRRRFAFVDVLPEIEPVHPVIKETFIKVSKLFIKQYTSANNEVEIEKANTLASDFRAEDVWLGHSYFICKNGEGIDLEKVDAEPILKMKMKYEVIPILKEYIKDGILVDNDEVKKVMSELVSEYGM